MSAPKSRRMNDHADHSRRRPHNDAIAPRETSPHECEACGATYLAHPDALPPHLCHGCYVADVEQREWGDDNG